MSLARWRRVVGWGGGLLLAAGVAAAGWQAWASHHEAEVVITRGLDLQARIVAEQTARAFQAVDIVLRHLVQQQGGRLQDDDAALHRMLREQALGLVQVEGLLVARADGRMRAVSMGHPLAPESPNLRQYRLFEQMRTEPPGQLLVGNAGVSPVDGLAVFLVARRLEDAQGAFAGIAAARGRVDYFQRFYQDIQPEPGTRIALVHRSGVVLAQHPPGNGLGRPDPVYPRLGEPHLQPAAALRLRDAMTGEDVFAAVRAVPEYPVAVLITRDPAAALAGWRAQAIASGWRTLLLAAVSAALLVLLVRQLRRLEDDLAARARLEAQLRQAQKLEALGTLAGGIAHDFNNILAAVLGHAELAQGDASAGTRLRRHVDATVAAGLRAKSLVERILAFSRGGAGDHGPVHVEAVVAEAVDLVRPRLPAGLQLRVDLQAGDAAVRGEATQVHQVVMNLCANALQATVAGEVAVRADAVVLQRPLMVATSTLRPGHYVRIAVEDSGSGIAPAIQERIFDPFFTTRAVGAGTGLGLSLVHGIVMELGGGIEVRSAPGAGATFTVYLPRAAADVPRPQRDEAPPPRGQGQVVMLVDDEAGLVRLGEEVLAELGYEPVGFASSAAALAAFRAQPCRFDALLTDEAMPELAGCELAREVLLLRPGLPVLLASGAVTPSLVERACAAGVREVLRKPLAVRELARSLAGALPLSP